MQNQNQKPALESSHNSIHPRKPKRNRLHMLIGNLVFLSIVAGAIAAVWLLILWLPGAIRYAVNLLIHVPTPDRQTLCIVAAIILHAIITRRR